MRFWLAMLGLSLTTLSLFPIQVNTQEAGNRQHAAALWYANSAGKSTAVAALVSPLTLQTSAAVDSRDGRFASVPAGNQSAQGRIANHLRQNGFQALPLFFGFGLLLAFTPCVFPMIPILSALIVGQGSEITKWQGFTLSLSYVLAMAVTYSAAGVLAAYIGQDVHVLFQSAWVLVAFSAVFVILAFSMFGFYDLQLPTPWQERLAELSNRQRGGSYLGIAAMGALSALIVGPCVAPPLVGVLAVIGATGDVLLGGTALFVMSLGMGAPLLLVGASAGHFLPAAGVWMDRVKAVFGVLLLGVAIWILERVLPQTTTMLLWAVLLVVSAVYMGATDSIGRCAPAWRVLTKGLGVMVLSYGILLLIGVAADTGDPLYPLRHAQLVVSQRAHPSTSAAGQKTPGADSQHIPQLWSDGASMVKQAFR